jgi:hypothetical protein
MKLDMFSLSVSTTRDVHRDGYRDSPSLTALSPMTPAFGSLSKRFYLRL